MTMGEEQKPMKIHIETSGGNSISGSYDWITLSPKRHSPPKNYFLKNCNEIKIIINEIEGCFSSSHEFLVSHHEHPTLHPANLTKKALFPA